MKMLTLEVFVFLFLAGIYYFHLRNQMYRCITAVSYITIYIFYLLLFHGDSIDSCKSTHFLLINRIDENLIITQYLLGKK